MACEKISKRYDHYHSEHKTNIIVIVQARMGSSRLPGKVMMDIVGKPLLWHIVNRLKHSKLLNKIVVATGIGEENHVIEELCKQYSIDYFRGCEEDLIDRYYQTSKLFNADIIVRIPADCPLVDPEIVDTVVDFALKNVNSYDYVNNSRPHVTYPHGLDVETFSFCLLERLWSEIKDPFRREWFTTVIFENPEKYKSFCLENDVDLSHLRLTVDYKEDLELIRYIFQNLYTENTCFTLKDILELYSRNQKIFNINQKYKKDEQYFEELEKRRLL
jgi:spore coat polysaccharide biosynthesis protein SpsF|tara:strand:- start:294 stop:1115 length:822 start_codon:yes stop_codon:yes gene_type:complete